MKPFYTWKINDSEEYKLKLTTGEIARLEDKYDTDIITLMMKDGQMPKLREMLDIVHASMQKFSHGTTRAEVDLIYDRWLDSDENNSLITFYSTVYMGIACVSGFFPQETAAQMLETIEEAATVMSQKKED